MVEEGELELLETKPKELTGDDIDEINMWVCLKDKFNISNEACHELATKCKDVCPQNIKYANIDELNANWNRKSTPGEG